MFVPNTFCLLSSAEAAWTVNGEPIAGASKRVPCAVVHLNKKEEKTTVRADSSASRGAAEEDTSTSKVLFPVSVAIKLNDKVEIAGFKLRATGVERRFDIDGRHDHNEVSFGIWE